MTERMMTGMIGGLRRLGAASRCGVAAIALGAAGLLLGAPTAEARTFVESKITLNLATGDFDANYTFGGETKPLTSPLQIADASFTRMELRVKLPNREAENRLNRKVDESYEPEDSGCRAGFYGPLTMEDGLRYFFETTVPGEGGAADKVSAVIFPGNRSDHFSNDVFCEFDEALGDGGAVFRLTGFFYVIHRRTEAGWDVQLRAVQLTDQEVEKLFP